MSVSFQWQSLYQREPRTFFLGGILGGVLLFLVWLALHPAKHATGVQSLPGARVGLGQRPIGADGAVLSSITGDGRLGGAAISSPGDLSDDDGSVGLEVQELGDPALADDGSTLADDGSAAVNREAFAEGELEAHAEPDFGTAAVPTLQTWYVEVLREDGQQEVLQVNAESPQHAISIVRDYRGNPRIVRGPSLDRLD